MSSASNAHRRSLALFGRWQLRLPFFVMYRFPADFTGSSLCWRGEVLWEGQPGEFERIAHADWGCRTLQPADIGRRIFGLAIGPDAALAMSLSTGWSVKLRGVFEMAATTIAAIGILVLLVQWRPRRMVFPAALAAATLVLVVLIDVTFIGGYRPFDGGDDGLVFSGFARDMLQHLVAGDIMGALKGFEPVFYFNPGMRYFRALEYLIFGDSFLGYLLIMLLAPPVFYAAVARFAGPAWGFVFTIGFVLTPVGVLFGTSYLHHVSWAARGYAVSARRDRVSRRTGAARRALRRAVRSAQDAGLLGCAADGTRHHDQAQSRASGRRAARRGGPRGARVA